MCRARVELWRRRVTVPSAEADHSGSAERHQSGGDRAENTGRRAAVDDQVQRRGREQDVVGQQKQPDESQRAHGRGHLQPSVGPSDPRAPQHEHIVSLAQHSSPVPQGEAHARRNAGQKVVRGQSPEAVRVGALYGQGRPVLRRQSVQVTAILVTGNL